MSRPISAGFTLIELVITMAVLVVLTLGVLPMVRTAVQREREQRLREMRSAIDEFHRDTAGLQCVGGPPLAEPGGQFIDQRSKVVISDCTIFSVDNPDRYPPDLETLVKGVSVVPRARLAVAGEPSGPNATDNAQLATSKKIYLTRVPVDPITGKTDWVLRSAYDPSDAASWGGQNVFDVRSAAEGLALNGEKYSDW
jgi:general secretion pathway protein G